MGFHKKDVIDDLVGKIHLSFVYHSKHWTDVGGQVTVSEEVVFSYTCISHISCI